MKFRNLLIIACAVLLCQGAAGCKKNKGEITEYDETLSGIDRDGNKIRDEIEERMRKEMATEVNDFEYKVLLQNARAFQEILNLDLESRPDVLLTRDHIDQAINCGIQIYGDGINFDHYTILLTKLKQWYFNTPERQERRQDFIFRSREYHFASTTALDEYTCDFEVPEAGMKVIEERMEIRRKKVEQELKEKGLAPANELERIAEEGAAPSPLDK